MAAPCGPLCVPLLVLDPALPAVPTSRARVLDVWSIALRSGFLIAAAGCQGECRTLCTEWYDFQRDQCGVVDTSDQRVRCIADYRTSSVSSGEESECVEVRSQLAYLVTNGTEAQREQCCTWDAEACDLRATTADDDSAAP